MIDCTRLKFSFNDYTERKFALIHVLFWNREKTCKDDVNFLVDRNILLKTFVINKRNLRTDMTTKRTCRQSHLLSKSTVDKVTYWRKVPVEKMTYWWKELCRPTGANQMICRQTECHRIFYTLLFLKTATPRRVSQNHSKIGGYVEHWNHDKCTLLCDRTGHY